jgi:hypothetical protein
MCRTYPGHEDVGGIRAKVLIIGRTYATGLERHTEGGLPTVAAATVAALRGQRRWLDPKLDELRRKSPLPSLENVGALAQVHGRLCQALQTATRDDHVPRSFVSKYVHFHAPIFPIFDSRANNVLKSRAWYPWQRTWTRSRVMPEGADPLYWQHCVRVAHMAADWRNAQLRPTSRMLDVYLLAWLAENP